MRIAQMRDHMDALVALVKWVEEEKIGSQRLPEIVRYWRAHLDRHGSLDHLIKRPLPRPVPHTPPRRHPEPDDLVFERLIYILDEWVNQYPLSTRQAKVVRRRLLHIRSILAGMKP